MSASYNGYREPLDPGNYPKRSRLYEWWRERARLRRIAAAAVARQEATDADEPTT